MRAFDDEFVNDVRERVEAEIKLCCDMRTRGTLTQSILTNFNRALLGRYGFSRRKALRLTDVAERILMMGTAIAMGLHYRAEVVEPARAAMRSPKPSTILATPSKRSAQPWLPPSPRWPRTRTS